MAWTTPRTWATGELVTALTINRQLRDNAAYLYSLIAAPGALSFASTGTLNDWAPGDLTFVDRLIYTGGGVTINGLLRHYDTNTYFRQPRATRAPTSTSVRARWFDEVSRPSP